nr:hypothetical protein DM860_006432 [Ipomoea trifida]
MEGGRTMTTTVMMRAAIMTIAVLLFIVPGVKGQAGMTKRVEIENNHTSYLSIRCFSFEKSLELKHLAAGEKYTFDLKVRRLFPSATMYNCSTNMGTFVVFRHSYNCASLPEYPVCTWRFDDIMTYLYNPKYHFWGPYEYNPNYESLNRGGVIRGYFVN